MKPELADLLSVARMSVDIIGKVQNLQSMVDNAVDYKEVTDIAAVLNKASEAYDTVKKVLARVSDYAQAEAAKRAINAGDFGPIRTELVTASIRTKSWYKFPSTRRSNPERFDELMKLNGIPEHIYQNELVRWHGPACAEYFGNTGQTPVGMSSSDLSAIGTSLSFRWKENV